MVDSRLESVGGHWVGSMKMALFTLSCLFFCKSDGLVKKSLLLSSSLINGELESVGTDGRLFWSLNRLLLLATFNDPTELADLAFLKGDFGGRAQFEVVGEGDWTERG